MAKNMVRKPTRRERLEKFQESEEVIAGLPIIRQTEKLMDTLNHLVVEYTKKTTLRDADIKFFLLKRLIHIALRRRYISIGQYEELVVNYLLDIGNQLGGWIQKESDRESQGRKT